MGKKADLTGQRFGKLVVLGECEERSNRGLVMWSCLCDCGKQTEVRTASLKNGNTKSCGCMTTKVDLTGKRFGKWTVLGDIGKRTSSGTVMWNCLCDCGEQKDVSGHSLRRGKSTSCGCSKIRNLVGLRFGKLVVVSKNGENNKYGRVVWNCICDCGNQSDVTGNDLANGDTKSCGCLKVEKAQLRKGINHYRYDPNITDEERLKNRYELYGGNVHRWSKQVMERDTYTCQICGNSPSGNLNAHHLNGWNAFPEQRFDLDNGVTLCNDCHKDFHSQYGYGDNTREQFDEYAVSKTLILN